MADETFTQKVETISATATGTLDLTGNILESRHVNVGVTFLDSTGAVITPTAGTYDITIRPAGMDNFVAITDGTAINATVAVADLFFMANAQVLRYTPTAIAGNDVTNVRITVSANKG